MQITGQTRPMRGDLAEMTAVVLAGGQGTRLRQMLADRPKVLAEVNGRPFLSFLLDQLTATGITNVTLCTGYLGEQIEAAYGSHYENMALTYSRESSPLDTAGAIRQALPLLGVGPVLVMNGDSFCDADFHAYWAAYCSKGVEGMLLLTEVPDTTRFGQVKTDASDRILLFSEKGSAPGAGWINAGIYLLSHALLRLIPGDRRVSLEREMFPAWVENGLYACCVHAPFIDIGTPDAYLNAERFMAERCRQTS